ncbi:MAG: flavin reductase family protein [Victivallales bacterium]|jgi:flavin reductase (DIM6/NTAB) family NADH-FMN oxidoreductase RutF|nr:flavin reductase family protein [Victivallales bacterium]MBT7162207.1 flavin reductase family protein [Victivallales bacterium]MBT7304027.1 flavin reductase family protein [Victivallales bacterium]
MNLSSVSPLTVLDEAMAQLPRGAFLTVKHKHRVNTMTIGWALAGVAWGKPTFTALVRTSRHTFKLIEQARDFTISVPTQGTQVKELGFCGTRSGADVDKIAECGFELTSVAETDCPLLTIPGLHFACRTRLRAPMDPSLMDPGLAGSYPKQDYHTFYHGEIVGAWRSNG